MAGEMIKFTRNIKLYSILQILVFLALSIIFFVTSYRLDRCIFPEELKCYTDMLCPVATGSDSAYKNNTVQITDLHKFDDHSVSIPHYKSATDGPSYFDLQIFPGLSTGTIHLWDSNRGVSTYVSGLHVGYYLQSPHDGMSVYLHGLDGASGKKIATKIIHDGIVRSGISVSSKLFSNNNVIRFALTKLGNISENLAITSSTNDNIFGSNRIPFKFSVNSSVAKPVNIVNSLKNVKINVRKACTSSNQTNCACIDPSFEPSSNFFCNNLEFNSKLGVYGAKGTKSYTGLSGGNGTSFNGECEHSDNPQKKRCYVRFCRNADPNHDNSLIYQANINSGSDNKPNGINSFINSNSFVGGMPPPTLGRDGDDLNTKYINESGYGQYVQYQDIIFCKGTGLNSNNVGESAGSPQSVTSTGKDPGVGVALKARVPNIKDTSTPSGTIILGFN
jgi:hypothetical protein